MDDHVDRIVAQWAHERPDLDASAIHVVGRIARAAHFLQARWNTAFARYGLTRGEFDVLASLRRAGDPYSLSPTHLAEALLLSPGAMTNRIDRLVRAGLVRRDRDRSDRRAVTVTLTRKGRVLIDRMVTEHLQRERQLLGELGPEAERALGESLRGLLLLFESEP